MSHLKASNKITFYLARMQSRGFTHEQVLAGTGLTPEQVNEVFFRPEPEQYRAIIHTMQRLTRDPFLGVTLGSEFKISDLGVMGYAALSSANLAQSRQLWSRYGALSEGIVHTNNRVGDEQWYSEVNEYFPLGDILPFAVEEFASQTMTMGSSLTEKPFPVTRMYVSYARPQDMSVYDNRFDCPIFFNQPRNVVYFDVACLNNAISLANEEVFEICERQCQILISKLESSCSLSTDIRNALVRKPGEFPTLEEMADMLKMGSRTLRRRLARENLSYQLILTETRRDLAVQYLEHSTLTPKEIGFLLGYNSVSNFRRAFKSWTGKKLSDYRP